jgi:nucleotide-binding universal stress UspA family protein
MGEIGSDLRAYLSLDKLSANPRLARRLPLDLARRFHALPVAEQDGRVTVAMADPDDREARQAVITALGSASCMVRADPSTIDTMLSKAWESKTRDLLLVGVWAFPDPVAAELSGYAQNVGDLLGMQASHLNTVGQIRTLTGENASSEYGMVIFGQADHPIIRRLLAQKAASEDTGCPQPGWTTAEPFALLVAEEPRWPIRNILLILWGEASDEAAVDWVLRLGRASGSAVTALAIVPPVPAMYGRRPGLSQGLPTLLSSNTSMGRQMSQVARHLVEWEIKGTLRLREGAPDWQIRREMVEGDYDLIALAAKPGQRWLRWLERDLAYSLLRWTSRPVLIARPSSV